MRIVILSLVLILLVASCVSAPAQSHQKPASVSPKVSETLMPTLDGVSIYITERVGTVIALQTASSTPIPTKQPSQTPILLPTSTPTTLDLSDLTSVAEVTQNPLFEKNCNTSSYRYFFNNQWGVCDTDDKTFVVFSVDGRVWQYSYIKLGLALADEGSEYYTRAIYWTKDDAFAYFSPSPRNYDPLGPFYGDGIALLRVNLTNGQIQTVLPNINRYYSISFSPTGRQMGYAAFNFDKQPLDLIVQDLQSGELKHIQQEQKYDQVGEFSWSADGLKLAYKLIIDGDECSRKFAIRLLDINTKSATTIIDDMQVDTCQELDPTYYINQIADNSVILEKHGDVWVYTIATHQLLLQATATPKP